MAEGADSCKLLVFLNHKEILEESLLQNSDLLEFSTELSRYGVISEVVKDTFTSLDHDHLDPSIEVRYLLQQVCERVREDDKVYDRLVRVLSRLRGAKDVREVMRKELDRIEGRELSGEIGGDVSLTESDIPELIGLMVSGSHKWEEICIALGLPRHVREECTYGTSNVFKLDKILAEWISGGYGFRSATLGSLRKALDSTVVGLHDISQHLLTFKRPFPVVKKARLDNRPEITFQSWDTEVAEGKSTLLEVQVSSSECESYQWSKDGQPLLDGADFSGVSSNMLYIDRASKGTEGKYSCCVRYGSETVCSDEINLRVIHLPEKEHLMKLYSPKESEYSWPPVGNSTFIDLALIKQSPISRCDYYTVCGDMDDILESKERVEYEEVFREYGEGALVLVEGRPGSGKTTLVHKVTRDWATGRKVLQGAKMVFLITLRLLNFSGKDRSLIEILEEFYDDELLGKSVEHDLQECGGKGACFIIDGLNEYQHKNKKESVIYQLIEKKCLRSSMVIVASRPVATDEVKKYSAKRIEVIGFTIAQIFDYVRTYPFDRFDAESKLKAYLYQHPNILHMCYLPVHAAMICFLFSQLEGNMPHTETQIYEQFTIATLLRHRMRHAGTQVQLKCLQDLCGEEELQFRSICKLAFDMIMNSQQVVSQSDTQVSLSDATSSVLGLLTVEHTSRHYGVEHLYTFHHLTFQEFLAALYIARLAEHEQECVITKYSKHSELKNVWKFYCGVAQKGNTSCLQNVLGSVQVLSLHQVQCAFESQQVELCDYVVGDGTVSLECTSFTPSDFAALGYVISTASQVVYKLCLDRCTWDYEGVMALSTWITIERLLSIKCLQVSLDDSNEDFKAVNGLLSLLPCLEELSLPVELNKSDVHCLTRGVQLSQLRILNIQLPVAPCSHPEEVLKLLTFGSHNIKQVYCSGLDSNINFAMWRKWLCYAFGFQVFQDSDISWVHLYNSDEFSSLPQERFSCSTEILLVNCGIDDEGAEILAIRLNPAVLEKLVLDFNRISDSGAVALAWCIARCSVVQEVSIQCNSIGDLGAIALADALVHCSSLRRLDLQGNGLGDEGAIAIAKAVESLPNLDLYLHNVNITEEGVERVLEHRASTKIRAMVFGSSWDAISDAGIDALRSALNCGTLPALKISTTNIYNIEILVAELEHVRNIGRLVCDNVTYDTLPTLYGIIKSMDNLQHLECDNINSISSDNAQLLSDCLKLCKNVRSLSLHNMMNVSIQSGILDAVKCCTNLQSLDMSGCKIGSEGVALLCDDHQCWVNLHTLNLSYNKIGSGGAQVLSKVLVHCNNLRCLDLTSNDIGDDGAVALAEGLKDLTSLLELRLGNNRITSQGALALVEVLKYNHLQCLDLSLNSIGSESMAALVDVICANSLHTLELGVTDLCLDDAVSLSAGLKSCRQLVELDISSNNIGSHGMSSLAEGLKSCRQLVRLNISQYNIGSHGMSSLAEGLQYCTNLQELYLSNNNITPDGVAAITVIMKRCRYLQVLDLSSNSIGVDGAAVLVGGWQQKSMLILYLYGSLGDPHQLALRSGKKCCSSCDHLLELYYKNDAVRIEEIPKLVSSSWIME